MKEELRKILDSIVADLRSQGHDPLDRPVVFIWDYDEELKYTLVLQAKSDPDVIKSADLH